MKDSNIFEIKIYKKYIVIYFLFGLAAIAFTGSIWVAFIRKQTDEFSIGACLIVLMLSSVPFLISYYTIFAVLLPYKWIKTGECELAVKHLLHHYIFGPKIIADIKYIYKINQRYDRPRTGSGTSAVIYIKPLSNKRNLVLSREWCLNFYDALDWLEKSFNGRVKFKNFKTIIG
ncbi:MAG: hypothetical protein GY795_22640 [Desulfobacterales bacterium]|nr:hypothetical protein [Desulfobacterales bacterium]